MARGNRQDQYAVSVVIDGVNTGVWDKMSGGEMSSEDTKYKPGAMAKQVSLGGSQNLDNVTVSRLFDLDRDNPNVKTWMNRCGKAPVVVTKQPLDHDGAAYGDPIVYGGTLLRCTPPEHDSESSDAALLEIEVSTDGTIA
jgi:hypothetical protein